MRSWQKRLCGLVLLLGVLGGCARTPEALRDKYLTRGKEYFQKHDYLRAILQFKNAARTTPNDAEVYYQLGLAYDAERDPRLAVASYQKAVALNPKHPGAQLRLSQLMASTDNRELLEDAHNRLQALLDGGEPNTEVLNSLALTQLKLGESEDAIRNLERALILAPGELKTSVMLATAKLQQKDAKGAEDVLLKACNQLPKSADARRILGEFYGTEGRLQDAQAQFQLARGLDPKHGAALYDLARLQLSMGHKPQAEESFRTLAGFEEFRLVYALYLFQENRSDEAVRELERVTRQYPDDRQARTYLVAAYKAVNRQSDVDRVLGEALKKNPNDPDALLEHGEILIERGNLAQAERDLNQCQKLRPEAPEVHYVLAHLHQARNEMLSYRQELSEALRLNPALLTVRLELANDYLRQKESAPALDTLNAAPSSQKSDQAFLVTQNWAFWTKGSLKEMRQSVDAALAHGRSPALLVQDGLLKLRSGDPVGARKSIEEALKINPADLLALQALNQSYVTEKNGATALEKVRQYAAAEPRSAPIQEFFGQLLLASGHRAEARAAFNAAKANSGKSVQPDLDLAQLDVAEGKLADAHKRLMGVASTDGAPPFLNLWMGNIEEMQGDHKTAIEHFRNAVQANPGDAQSANNLAYLIAESGGNLDEALTYAQKAVELAPTHSAFSDTLGWILYRKGLYPAAVRYLEKAGADPANVAWKYHLAMAYAKVGDLKRGRSALDAALKINPNTPEASAARQLVQVAQP